MGRHTPYTIRSIESQEDGTIIIEGYVQQGSGRVESFLVTDNAPGIDDVDDTQVPTMYAVSGIGVVITGLHRNHQVFTHL